MRISPLFFVVICSGCARQNRDPPAPIAAPPAAAAPSTSLLPVDPVSYGPGFFAQEKDATGLVWHWMADEGFVLLKNNRLNSRLRLEASAPIDNAILRLELNGEILEEFAVAVGNFEKDYGVPAERQDPGPWSELHIVTSAALKAQRDPRRLGLRVFDIRWYPE
jgi:hypothetical protein